MLGKTAHGAIALLTLICISASPVHAGVTIYSNLGPGDTHSGNSGTVVRGPDHGPMISIDLAAPFTPTTTQPLGSVDVAIYYTNDGQPDVRVVLMSSSGGQPDQVIEDLGTLNSFPFPGNNSDSFASNISSTTNPVLQSGTLYFIAVLADDPNTNVTWAGNNQGVNGHSRSISGGAWTSSSNPQMAFRVNATENTKVSATAWQGVVAMTLLLLSAGAWFVARRRTV